MIVEWLGSLWVGLIEWFDSLFGPDPLPDWVTSVGGMVQDVINGASGLGAWVPWALAIAVFSLVGGIWLIAVSLKFVRWLVGWIPTMGGS